VKNLNKMDRFLKTAELRDLENKLIKEDISYSKMIEEINYKAFVFYTSKSEIIDIEETVRKVIKHLLDDNFIKTYIENNWTIDEITKAMISRMVTKK